MSGQPGRKRYNVQEAFYGVSFESSPYLPAAEADDVDVYKRTVDATQRSSSAVARRIYGPANPLDVIAREADRVLNGKRESKRGGIRLGLPPISLPAISKSYAQRRKKDSANYNEFAQEGGADIWGIIDPNGVGAFGHKMRGIELQSQSLESAADIEHLNANGGTADPVKLSYRLPRDTNSKAIGLRPALPVVNEEIRVMLRNSQREGTMHVIQLYVTGRTVGTIVCTLSIGGPSKDPGVFFEANRSRLKREAIQGDQPGE